MRLFVMVWDAAGKKESCNKSGTSLLLYHSHLAMENGVAWDFWISF
jgi:hypothetical protein